VAETHDGADGVFAAAEWRWELREWWFLIEHKYNT
jgi:hypothetical protein